MNDLEIKKFKDQIRYLNVYLMIWAMCINTVITKNPVFTGLLPIKRKN